MVREIGSVTTNHNELTMEFNDGDKRVQFQDDPQLAESELSKLGLRRLIERGEIAYLCYLRGENSSEDESKSWPELVEVLKEFEDVLAEP